MNLKSGFGPLIILCLLLLAGCSKSDDQRKFEEQALASPNNITETDKNGDIVENNIDPDDWRIGPMYAQLIEINSNSTDPPFPNPLNYNSRIQIQIFLPYSDNLSLDAIVMRKFRLGGDRQYSRIPLPNSNQLSVGINNFLIAGSVIAKSAGNGVEDLYRILIYDGNENLISYGDVRIE